MSDKKFFKEQWQDGNVKSCLRSLLCHRAGHGGICSECCRVRTYLKQVVRKKEKTKSAVVSTKAPLKFMEKQEVSSALKEQRRLKRQLQRKMSQLKSEIDRKAVVVDNDLHASLLNVMASTKLSHPLCKLFWAEQEKALKKSAGHHK